MSDFQARLFDAQCLSYQKKGWVEFGWLPHQPAGWIGLLFGMIGAGGFCISTMLHAARSEPIGKLAASDGGLLIGAVLMLIFYWGLHYAVSSGVRVRGIVVRTYHHPLWGWVARGMLYSAMLALIWLLFKAAGPVVIHIQASREGFLNDLHQIYRQLMPPSVPT